MTDPKAEMKPQFSLIERLDTIAEILKANNSQQSDDPFNLLKTIAAGIVRGLVRTKNEAGQLVYAEIQPPRRTSPQGVPHIMTDQEIEAIRARYKGAGIPVPSDPCGDICTLLSALDAARASQRERELRLIALAVTAGQQSAAAKPWGLHFNAVKVADIFAAIDEQEKAREPSHDR